MYHLKARLLQSGIMSFILCTLMTCWVTFINLGLTDAFIGRWMNAFLLAWPIAYAIAFAAGPFVARLTARLLADSRQV
ncbi:DUF2798 domain-containing protein [Marinobacterium mangrovicola]|uniref:Uncharacterized protein DUF2798 n=1 Tax=Marinobacterium mangrovicola TaxID=1476959 RepID=A0A4R1GIW8_9GAMM|nr:DUF2798 domain-containing protein [Marinobacterium mangrovicola]TCK08277.1 uncharacterized protein DUF2798 [Marinobacterium mangrovicola]